MLNPTNDLEFSQYAPSMADNHHNLIDSPSPPPLGMRHQSAFSAAEIVEVQGGHIVRSTGRKDRHSKVCTAKGPRDRRVRLSAPTAIQFYDVQDRLGFDRPSKAVDWLIKKAKSAIDDLDKLPPWNPVDTLHHAKPRKTKTLISPTHHENLNLPFSVSTREETEHNHHQRQIGEENNESSFLPPSMHSDSIADTIKSFFPVGIGVCGSTQQIYHHQQQYQPPSNTQSQDLRLSLQTFPNEREPILFSDQSNIPLGFDTSTTSWDHQNHQSPDLEFGKIQKLVSGATLGGGGGFVFASPSSFQPVISQSQHLSQRGSLQSINTPMIRAWFDPYHHHHHQSITSDDLHHHHHHPYHIPPGVYQSAIPSIAFASNGELSSSHIPSRFQGEQEEHGDKNKPSSASSDSRH